MSNSLDMLCDLLDESDGEQQAEISPTENERNIAATSATETEVATEPHQTDDNEEEMESMEAQLRAMQEQMKKMQQMLEEKKSSKQQQQQTGIRKMSDVDLFSKPSCSSTSLGSSVPRSPVKTNPFAESDRPRKQAKTFLNTPVYGPALPVKKTRILEGEEKKKLLDQFESKKLEQMAAIVRDDLANSSDDEESQRNPREEKYNSFGKEIKRIAAKAPKDMSGQITAIGINGKVGFNQIKGATLNITDQRQNKLLPKDLMIEKFSRLKVSKPKLDSQIIEAHMLGKAFVPIFKLRDAIGMGQVQGDWTTIGVVYYKATQTSKNGNIYTQWRMTDLAGDIKTVTVLLFGKSHNVHYKLPLNTVVGLLNAKIMEERSGTVTLSVDHPDKVLEIGESVEAGKCQAKKADGTGCTNLVNLSSCEYCTFHVKKAYKEISSKRGDIQSSFSSAGVRSRIMNKIDPKGNYFAGGQSVNNFEPVVPAKLSDAHRNKESQRLASLGINPVDRVLMAEEKQKDALAVFYQNGKPQFRSHLSNLEKKAVKDVAHGVSAELGLKLLAPTPGARSLIRTLTKEAKIEEEKEKLKLLDSKAEDKSASKLIFEHKKRLAEERARKVLIERQAKEVPKLGRGMLGSGDMVDLSVSADPKKAKALLALKGKTIEKSCPNYVPSKKRKAGESGRLKAKKMSFDDEAEITPDEAIAGDRVSSAGEILSKERLERIRKGKSRNENLVDDFENEQQERRMDEMEKKEAMEEKMISTKEVETRAVSCMECVYTAYSQSDRCRELGHKVKVLRVKKKFFECKKCTQRTTALDKYPSSSCSNCGSASWVRTGMMREKKGPLLDSERLLIRGSEQKFVNQSISSTDMALDSIS